MSVSYFCLNFHKAVQLDSFLADSYKLVIDCLKSRSFSRGDSFLRFCGDKESLALPFEKTFSDVF